MPRVSDAKEKILEAAKELFWLHNYGSVSVDDICKKADVKKGSFYHFYESKSDLCVACLESYWDNFVEILDSIFSPSKPTLARISNYAEMVYIYQSQLQQKFGMVLGCPICLTSTELSTEEEKVRVLADELFIKYSKYFESVLREANSQGLTSIEDVGLRARQIVSFSKGVLYHAKITNNPEVIKEELEPGILVLMQIKT